MSQIQEREIFNEIEGRIKEDLQVISYKWLARQLSIPYSTAKKVLFQYLEKHGGEVEAVYYVSGWTKGKRPYHVHRLIDAEDLPNVRDDLEPVTDMHIFSLAPSRGLDPKLLHQADAMQLDQRYTSWLGSGSTSNKLRSSSGSAISNSNRSSGGNIVTSLPLPPMGAGSFNVVDTFVDNSLCAVRSPLIETPICHRSDIVAPVTATVVAPTALKGQNESDHGKTDDLKSGEKADSDDNDDDEAKQVPDGKNKEVLEDNSSRDSLSYNISHRKSDQSKKPNANVKAISSSSLSASSSIPTTVAGKAGAKTSVGQKPTAKPNSIMSSFISRISNPRPAAAVGRKVDEEGGKRSEGKKEKKRIEEEESEEEREEEKKIEEEKEEEEKAKDEEVEEEKREEEEEEEEGQEEERKEEERKEEGKKDRGKEK